MAGNPDWLEVVKVTVPLLSGGVVGAWIGAHLTTRRERWNLRRQLYADFIGELVDLESRVRDLETSFGPPPLPDVPLRCAAMLASIDRVNRALAVAKIVIKPGIAKTLDDGIGPASAIELKQAPDLAASMKEMLGRLRSMLIAAVRDLQNDARRDLLGASGWTPPEALQSKARSKE